MCQALAYSVQSGDWYSLLAALNDEQAPARLHWLATLLMDALKRHHRAAQVTNVDVPGLVVRTGKPSFSLAPAGYTGDVCHIREQLMSVTGINRESSSPIFYCVLSITCNRALCYRFLIFKRDIMFLVDSHCHLDGLDYESLHKDVDDVLRKPPHAM